MIGHPESSSFSQHIDGVLGVAETAFLEKHMSECAACRESLASLRQIKILLSTVPIEVVPPDFASETKKWLGRLDSKPEIAPAWTFWNPIRLWMPAAMTAMAAVLIGILLRPIFKKTEVQYLPLEPFLVAYFDSSAVGAPSGSLASTRSLDQLVYYEKLEN